MKRQLCPCLWGGGEPGLEPIYLLAILSPAAHQPCKIHSCVRAMPGIQPTFSKPLSQALGDSDTVVIYVHPVYRDFQLAVQPFSSHPWCCGPEDITPNYQLNPVWCIFKCPDRTCVTSMGSLCHMATNTVSVHSLGS